MDRWKIGKALRCKIGQLLYCTVKVELQDYLIVLSLNLVGQILFSINTYSLPRFCA